MSGELVTVCGTLPVGVLVGGVRHRDFEVRSATVQDNIEAAAEVDLNNPVEMSAALAARQLVRLGALNPPPKLRPQLKAGEVMPTYIDTDLIRRMSVQDYNAIERAMQEVEKKVLLDANEPPGGQRAEPSSPATTSPSSTP